MLAIQCCARFASLGPCSGQWQDRAARLRPGRRPGQEDEEQRGLRACGQRPPTSHLPHPRAHRAPRAPRLPTSPSPRLPVSPAPVTIRSTRGFVCCNVLVSCRGAAGSYLLLFRWQGGAFCCGLCCVCHTSPATRMWTLKARAATWAGGERVFGCFFWQRVLLGCRL